MRPAPRCSERFRSEVDARVTVAGSQVEEEESDDEPEEVKDG